MYGGNGRLGGPHIKFSPAIVVLSFSQHESLGHIAEVHVGGANQGREKGLVLPGEVGEETGLQLSLRCLWVEQQLGPLWLTELARQRVMALDVGIAASARGEELLAAGAAEEHGVFHLQTIHGHHSPCRGGDSLGVRAHLSR